MEQEITQRRKRPVFLTIICILSFVYIGIELISNISGLAMGPLTKNEMKVLSKEWNKQKEMVKKTAPSAESSDWIPVFEKVEAYQVTRNNNHYLASIIDFFTYVVGLIGVFFMFRGRRLGFHLYIVYSLMALGGTYLYVSPGAIPTVLIGFIAFFSLLFISFYALNLKWMKN